MLHFNSHAHVERDERLGKIELVMQDNFNSHAHVERDSYNYGEMEYISKFQLTRSRGA